MKTYTEFVELLEGKKGLWDNIHAKRKRIKNGSGEKMRKKGDKGAPSDEDFKNASESAQPLDEAEYQGRDVKLNSPTGDEGGRKKVYVKDGDKVKKVTFGSSMRNRSNNPAARKSFRARHKCDTAKDKTTARYWSCKDW